MSHTGKSSEYRGVTLFRPTMKWRAQISANGKTTSLGDHDSEELAAKAFDRAAINKAGTSAKTNFPMDDYKDEIEDLRAMTQVELVAMLRSKARKSGTQTSHFRGVSLLKQTSKWHAQINVGGKQVHLGFFSSEELAARAYDRAAINKGAKEGSGKIITNFDIADYNNELDWLRRISQKELVEVLASDGKRKQAMEMLATGLAGKVESVFGKKFPGRPNNQSNKAALEELRLKSERAQPKSTLKNPLYINFGKKAGGPQDNAPAEQAQSSMPASGKAVSPKSQAVAKPKKAAAFAKEGGSKQMKGPKRNLFILGEPLAEPKAAAPKEPGALGRGHRSVKPSEKLRDADAAAAGTSRGESTPEPSSMLSMGPTTPKRKRATKPATPASPASPATMFGPGAAARYAAYLDPHSPLQQPQKKRRSSLDGVAMPPTPQQIVRQWPGQGSGGAAGDAAAALAGIASSPAQANGSVQTLQELLRQQKAEHKRQQDERKALVSDVIERFMAPPLTKRQEALAARKQREAVSNATVRVTAGLRGAGMPEDMQDKAQEALFGFAEAAEQAAREDAGALPGGPATPGAAGQSKGASGSDTTITQTASGGKRQTPESEVQQGRAANRRRKGRPPARAAT